MRFFKLIVLVFIFLSCREKRESTRPHYAEIVEAVYTSVNIKPQDVYKVNASVSGYLEVVNVKEGDEVTKGDLLFVISNKPFEINEKNAELTLQFLKDSYSGKANVIDEMRLNLKSALLKFENDSLNYSRYIELDKKNSCSKVEFDNARVIYQVSKNNFQSLKTQISRKEKELKNQLIQSRNNLSLSVLKTGDFFIRSTIDGRVYQINKEIGELVSMQEPLAIVGATNYFAEMLIDEVDISKVELGQKVLITLEAYKNQVFEAEITEIAPKMDEKNQTFKIQARFTNPPKKLYMGLSGEGNIVVNEKKKALVIPREYLMSGSYVNTEAGKVKVKTGLSDWDFVEILSGINESTILYKSEQ